MADRPQRKIADHNDIASDDPFAELTRIMGFDPREPVAPRAEPRLVAIEPALDDFDIDLEKELMGEFGDFEAPQALSAEVAAPQPPAIPEAIGEPTVYDAPAMDDHLAPASGEDFDLDEDFSREADVYAAHGADDVAGREFDHAVAEAFGELHGEAEIGHESHGHASAEVEDFDAHFDQAMAAAEMDFPAAAIEAHEPVSPSEAHEHEWRQPATPEPVAEVAMPVQEAVPAPAAAVAGSDSLEDELNALLNRMSARPVMAAFSDLPADDRSAAPVDQEPANTDELDWALDKAAMEAEGEPAEPDFEAELLAGLEAEAFEDAPEEGDRYRPEHSEQEAPPVEAYADVHASDEAAEEEEASFDGEAFDAALAAQMSAEDEAPVDPVASDEPEDPIESLQWLSSRPAPQFVAEPPARVWGRGTPVAPVSSPAEAPVRAEAQAPAAAAPVDAYDYAAPEQDETEAFEEPAAEAAAGYDDVPDIETVDVPERVVALADDLDIPELAFEEDQAEAPAFDDLDAEFASLLNEMNAAEPVQAQARATSYEDEPYAAGFGRHAADQRAYADFSAAVAPVAAAAAATGLSGGGAPRGFAAQQFAGGQVPAEADPFAVTDDLDFDPDLEEAMAIPAAAQMEAAGSSRRRGLLIAGVIGAVAVVGGLGAFALSFGGKGASDAPAIVKADNQPIKVKPENPGGTVIPNQDNKVYDAVAKGAKPAAPAQQTLVAKAEEPVDVTAQEPQARIVNLSAQEEVDAAAPTMPAQAGKSEDRIVQTDDAAAPAGQDTPLVTPRKVRTMVVKPDGSLVPREEAAPVQVAAVEPIDPAPQHVAAPAAQDADAVAPAAQAPAKPAAQSQSVTPARAPVAPQRPSDQPVNVVGEVKPDQVASIDSGAAAAGSWSVQIASQPTAESAQATYDDLARRYAGVLQGRSASIVKAEVAGKGTFYRVRVATQSRNDAIALCTSYKAAGGNCFVSK
ncbi:SPOR domain-containing protein [Mesorhizobium sp. PUT5]|uniref:SPOR domain-containing protein n=1 Tax=Mesorhizobium sp. PUT5 TaxID=3454629 RepID=UPI003FA44771